MHKLPRAMAWMFVAWLLVAGCAARRKPTSIVLSESGGNLIPLRHDVADLLIDNFDGTARKEFEQDFLRLIEETLPPRDSKDIEAFIEGNDLVIRMPSERQVLLLHLLSQLREQKLLEMWVVADLFRFDPGSDNAIRQRLDSVAITPGGSTPDGRLTDPRKALKFTEVDDLAKAAREQGVSVISLPPQLCLLSQWCHYQVGVSPTISEFRNAEGARIEFPVQQPTISDGLKLAFYPMPREQRGRIYVRCQASLIQHGSSTPVVKGDRIVFTTSGIKRSLEGNAIVVERTGVVLNGFVSSRVSSDPEDSGKKSAPEPDPTLYLVVRVLEPGRNDPLAGMLYRKTVE